MIAGAALAMKFDLRNMLIIGIGVFPGLVLLAVSSERLLRASEFRPLAARLLFHLTLALTGATRVRDFRCRRCKA
jgi:hypothetical protein